MKKKYLTLCMLFLIFSGYGQPWKNMIPNYSFEVVEDDFPENSENKHSLLNFTAKQWRGFQDSKDLSINKKYASLSLNAFYGFPFFVGVGSRYQITKPKNRASLVSHYIFGQKWSEKYHGFDVGIQFFSGDKWMLTYGVNFLMLFNLTREYNENSPNPNHHVLSIFEPNINIGVGYALKSFDFLFIPNFSFYRYYRFICHYGESGNDTRNYFNTIPRIAINFKF